MSSFSDDTDFIERERIRVHQHHRRDPSPAYGRRVPPPPPPGPHFIQTVTRDVRDRPPVGYYHSSGSRMADERMTMVHATTRSRSRERRSPPVHAAPAAPAAPQVVINQPSIYRGRPERDSDSSSDESSHSRRHRRHRGHRSHSHVRSRSSSTHSYLEDARDKWKLQSAEEQLATLRLEAQRRDEHRQMERYSKEQAELARVRADLEARQRREEEELRQDRYRDEYEVIHLREEVARVKRHEEELRQERRREEQAKLSKDSDELARIKREQEERRRAKQAEEETEYQKQKAELERRVRAEQAAKHDKAIQDEAKAKAALAELERIHAEKQRREEEERIRREMELKKLEEEKKAAEERKRKEKEADEAVAAWKAKEAERIEKEKKEKEARDKELQRIMQERLIHAGLDEKEIEAVMKNEKIKRKKEEDDKQVAAPTHTRMSLRYLDVETLIQHKIEFDVDPRDPTYVIIRRWVPEWEQTVLWEHTRQRRSGGERIMLEVDDHRHHHGRHKSSGAEYEFVRRKPSRHRSKSPGLLMYLAGGRPR